MGVSLRASWVIAAAVALGCGGRAIEGAAADAAARDAAGGQDVAAKTQSVDVGVTTEAGELDATISDAGSPMDATIPDVAVPPEAAAMDGDATPDASLESEAGSDAASDVGCVPTTCAQLGWTCGPTADGCGGLLNCGSCVAPQYCGGGGFNRCGPSPMNPDGSSEAGDAGICGTGSITFRLDPGPGGPWRASLSGDEEPNWLALFTASGTPLYQNPAEWALTDCDCAKSYEVPIGWWGQQLTDAGITQSWDGFYFDLKQFGDSGTTCSLGYTGGSCLVPECASPGQYVAYMCACNSPGTGSFSRAGVPSNYAYYVADCPNPTCVRVLFEYPSQTLVVGTVSESDQ